MQKKDIWKWVILIGVTAWSLSIVYPPFDQKDSKGNLTRPGKVTYGLDLKGGSRFVLQIDTKDLTAEQASDAAERALEVIRGRVDAMGVSEPVIYTEPGNRIIVEIPGLKPEDRERAKKNVQSAAFLEFRMVHPNNEVLIDELLGKDQAPEGYKVVEVPDHRSGGAWDYKRYYRREQRADNEEQIRERARLFHIPSGGYELLMEEEEHNKQKLMRPFFVSKRRELTGENLDTARVDYDQFNRPVVNLKFDAQGAKKFANITKDYAPGGAKNPNPQERRYLGIVLDGKLYSSPYIKEPIFGGSAQIEGNFDVTEAKDLAIILRAGALPAPVHLLEERTVAPTLGEDSVHSGGMAALIGTLAVMGFMVVYYTVAGMVANVALLMNLVLMPLGLMITGGLFSMFTSPGQPGGLSLPTLTLPGIAGIALTIGMAVDANVLIYERMREEQKAGKRFKAIIAAGYDKAFSAIFDSNLTTLISAAILFWQGTGAVRGYAVTLSAGIIVSLYTALTVTRMIFDFLAEKTNIQGLKMMEAIREPKLDYLKSRWVCAALSLVVILGSWGMFAKKGKANFGVDFTGGSAVAYTFAQKIPMEKVRDTLEAAGFDPTIQYQTVAGATAREELEIKVGFDEGGKVSSLLKEKFPEAGFTVVKEDNVGPQIGSELQKKAIIATLLSLVGIIIYVSIRFEFPYAVGAVVALLHDVLVGVGVYCALGNQLSVNMVAALLTIIGYSVNDTIVIFDRIREILKAQPNAKFADVANAAMNQCMSRTLLTSFATMLTVVALLIIGGGAIKDFSLLLFIGMISGVYSTVYVATPIVMIWHRDGRPAAPAKPAAPGKAAPARA